MKQVTIHTDGGCSRNPGGDGAWAAVLLCGNARKEIAGYIPAPTTSYRAELAAIIEALAALKEPCEVLIRCDCNMTVSFLSGGRGKFSKRKNQDLLLAIMEAEKPHRVRAEWIKGHSGIEENERCDVLATTAMHAKANPNARYCTDKFEVYEQPRPEWPTTAPQFIHKQPEQAGLVMAATT